VGDLHPPTSLAWAWLDSLRRRRWLLLVGTFCRARLLQRSVAARFAIGWSRLLARKNFVSSRLCGRHGSRARYTQPTWTLLYGQKSSFDRLLFLATRLDGRPAALGHITALLAAGERWWWRWRQQSEPPYCRDRPAALVLCRSQRPLWACTVRQALLSRPCCAGPTLSKRGLGRP
jgi:hypothetical protein